MITFSEIILVFSSILSAYCTVDFNLPNDVYRDRPYTLKIGNPTKSSIFPPSGFMMELGLYQSLSSQNVISQEIITYKSSIKFRGGHYRGFSISNYTVRNNQFIMDITFKKSAHLTIFFIRYNVDNAEEAINWFMSQRTKYLIYKKKIQLLIKYEVVFLVGIDVGIVTEPVKNVMGNGLLPQQFAQATCRVLGDEGKPIIEFENINQLQEVKVHDLGPRKKIMRWFVQKDDHGTKIVCRVRNSSSQKTLSLNVFQYTTKLTTEPKFDNDALPHNKPIKCVGQNGYPPAKTQWKFEKGPKSSEMMYKILEKDRSVIVINESAPIGSKWTFSCSGSNFVPPLLKRYLQQPMPNFPIYSIFNFTATESLEKSQVKRSNSGMLAFLILIILALVLLLAAIVWWYNKNNLRRQTSSTSKNKNSGKMKNSYNADSNKYKDMSGLSPQQKPMLYSNSNTEDNNWSGASNRTESTAPVPPEEVEQGGYRALPSFNEYNNNNNINNNNNKNNNNNNNTDNEDDDTHPYTEIIATIQPKSASNIGGGSGGGALSSPAPSSTHSSSLNMINKGPIDPV